MILGLKIVKKVSRGWPLFLLSRCAAAETLGVLAILFVIALVHTGNTSGLGKQKKKELVDGTSDGQSKNMTSIDNQRRANGPPHHSFFFSN